MVSCQSRTSASKSVSRKEVAEGDAQSDLAFIYEEGDAEARKFRVAEFIEGLRTIKKLISIELNLSVEKDRIDLKNMMATRKVLGKIQRALSYYQTVLGMIVDEPEQKNRELQIVWADIVYDNILKTLEAAYKVPGAPEFLAQAQERADDVEFFINGFKKGKLSLEGCKAYLSRIKS